MTEHRVPAVDRAIEVLSELEARRGEVALRELSERLDIPKSTVYRILNSLEAGGLVLRTPSGGYVLGPRLLRLAQAVTVGFDLVSLSKPLIDELAGRLSATVKLSVLDGSSVMVVAAAAAPTSFSVTTQVGSRFPLHAGAASKAIAAWLDARELEQRLPAKLERFTDHTVVRRSDLLRELAAVRAQGYAKDEGEYTEGIRAFAVPIFDSYSNCIAALSIPFFGMNSPVQADTLLAALIATGERLSTSLGAAPTRSIDSAEK